MDPFLILFFTLFIWGVISNLLFTHHFDIIASPDKLIIEEKKTSVVERIASTILFVFLFVMAFFLEVFSNIYFIILGLIIFFFVLRWIFKKDKFLLRKRTLTIDKGSGNVILPDSQIKFEEMKSLEFTVVSDGESSSTVIKLILRNGKKVNLLAVERKKEAKVIYKFIYDILKLEGIYRIERGWLDDKVKEIDFV